MYIAFNFAFSDLSLKVILYQDFSDHLQLHKIFLISIFIVIHIIFHQFLKNFLIIKKTLKKK